MNTRQVKESINSSVQQVIKDLEDINIKDTSTKKNKDPTKSANNHG